MVKEFPNDPRERVIQEALSHLSTSMRPTCAHRQRHLVTSPSRCFTTDGLMPHPALHSNE